MAIIHLAIELDLKNGYHLVGTEKVAQQHIVVKCYKCGHFGVISNLFKVATGIITHLAMDLDLQ